MDVCVLTSFYFSIFAQLSRYLLPLWSPSLPLSLSLSLSRSVAPCATWSSNSGTPRGVSIVVRPFRWRKSESVRHPDSTGAKVTRRLTSRRMSLQAIVVRSSLRRESSLARLSSCRASGSLARAPAGQQHKASAVVRYTNSSSSRSSSRSSDNRTAAVCRLNVVVSLSLSLSVSPLVSVSRVSPPTFSHRRQTSGCRHE